MIDQKRLHELVAYDSDTGIFRRRKDGLQCGFVHHDGYLMFCVQGTRYAAHRLAWLYVHGDYPDGVIDHINRIKTDNRIANLRVVSIAENLQNRSVKKVSGIVYHKRRNKYEARIKLNGKRIHLGTFDNEIDARKAYIDAKPRIHKYYSGEHD